MFLPITFYRPLPTDLRASSGPGECRNGRHHQLCHKALDGIVDPTSSIFLATAQPLLDKLGLLALVTGALTWTYGYLTGNHIFSGEHFWRVLIRYMIAYNLLRYYNSPMPLVGYSFHQIFTQEARWMAAQIDISVLDRFLTEIQHIWGTMEKPHPWDIPATIISSGSGSIWP